VEADVTNMVKRAFPGLGDKGRGLQCIDDGMSLRDWFAGQALAGSLANGQPLAPDQRAANAFLYADKMMKARDAG